MNKTIQVHVEKHQSCVSSPQDTLMCLVIASSLAPGGSCCTLTKVVER